MQRIYSTAIRCGLICRNSNASLKGCQLTWPPFPAPPPFASLSPPPPLPPPTPGLFCSSSSFPFCFSVSSANLASLTLHTMKLARGKREEAGITSSDSRRRGSIYLAPPWELWLLTHLRLQQLWGIWTGTSYGEERQELLISRLPPARQSFGYNFSWTLFFFSKSQLQWTSRSTSGLLSYADDSVIFYCTQEDVWVHYTVDISANRWSRFSSVNPEGSPKGLI